MSLKRLPMPPSAIPIHPVFPFHLLDTPLEAVQSPLPHPDASFFDFEELVGESANVSSGDHSFFAAFENVALNAPDLFDFACEQDGAIVEQGEIVDVVCGPVVPLGGGAAPPKETNESSPAVPIQTPQPNPNPQHSLTSSPTPSWNSTFTSPSRQQSDLLQVLWKPSKQPITPHFTKKVYATLKYFFTVELLTNTPLETCCLAQLQIIHASDASKEFTEHISAENVLLARVARVPKEYKSQYTHAYRGTLKVALQGPKLSSYITKRKYRFRIVCTNETQDEQILETTSNVFKVYSRKEDKNKAAKRKRKRSELEGECGGVSSQSDESSSSADSAPKRRKLSQGRKSSPQLDQFAAKLEDILSFMSEQLPSKEHQERAWRLLFDSQLKLLQ